MSNLKHMFKTEAEAIEFIDLHIPFAIKAKSKHAKSLLVSPFTSQHAHRSVVEHLGKKLFKHSKENFLNK